MIVYDRGTVSIDSSLLVALIDSMVLLSKELGKVKKGYLKEIELGRYQISLLDHGELTYILIIGSYDNELFTRKILNMIVDHFHDDFTKLKFRSALNVYNEFQKELSSFVRTLNFPDSLFLEIDDYVEDLLVQANNKLDLFFITDLDNGIAKIFIKPKKGAKGLINVLMNVLSEIPLEKTWSGEHKLPENFIDQNGIPACYEGWIIHRIGLTEFCLVSRGFYNPEDRDNILMGIEQLSDLIHNAYINWSMRALQSAEQTHVY